MFKETKYKICRLQNGTQIKYHVIRAIYISYLAKFVSTFISSIWNCAARYMRNVHLHALQHMRWLYLYTRLPGGRIFSLAAR